MRSADTKPKWTILLYVALGWILFDSHAFTGPAYSFDMFPPLPKRRYEVDRDQQRHRIYVRNNCGEPIQVAFNVYVPGDTGGGRGSDAGIAQFTPPTRIAEGWWLIQPGTTAEVISQKNSHDLHYYGEAISGRFNWPGNASINSLRGRPLSFRSVDMGHQYGSFVLPFC